MFDVLIVGGGMVGASLACALGDKNNRSNSLKVGLIEARADLLQGQFGADGRASAVALGSSHIWQNIGVWDGMLRRGVSPMHCIQISDGDYPHSVKLRREDIKQEALGYVVENATTQAALWEFIDRCHNIEVICPAKIIDIVKPEIGSDKSIEVKISSDLGDQFLSAKLLVAADGGRSVVRSLANITTTQKHYDQTCIVLTVKTEHSHHNIAYERFQNSGPFAILPLPSNNQNNPNGDRCCIVWTAATAEIPTLIELDEDRFMQELCQRFGADLLASLGKLTIESKQRASYVPQWMHAQTYIQPRLALIGDAAHTTHPVAGQGMNLGIRDVGAIAEIILTAHHKGEDIGSIDVLKRYQTWRRWDNLGVIMLTDITNRLFSNQFFVLQWLRRIGLALASLLPFKRILMHFMMGLIGRQPRLPKQADL